jgi:hypothetical protein
MRRVQVAALALVLAGGACAQTHNIAVPVSDADLTKMRSQLNGKKGAVVYGEVEPPPGPGAPSSRPTVIEGTIYVDPFVVRMSDGGKEQSIPYTEVRKLQYVDYRRGRGQGVAIGAGVGVLLGGVGGYLAGEDCSPGEILCFDRTTTSATLAATLGLVGILAGALAGNSGAIDDWVFSPVDKR